MKTGPKPRGHLETLEAIQSKTEMGEAPYGLPDPCLLWQGRRSKGGYGKICFQGKDQYIHRWICNAEPNDVVRHKCDRPNCWQPEHLEKGTHAENVADKVAKARHGHGTSHYRTMLTDDKVRSIRASHTAGVPLKVNASDHGVGLSCVKSIVYGRSWTHVQ